MTLLKVGENHCILGCVSCTLYMPWFYTALMFHLFYLYGRQRKISVPFFFYTVNISFIYFDLIFSVYRVSYYGKQSKLVHL